MNQLARYNLKEKYDWKEMIELNIFMLRILGLWPTPEEIQRFSGYTLYTIICIICFISAHAFFQTMSIIIGSTNLEALTGTICITSSEILLYVKVCYFLQNIRKLENILMSLESELFQPKTYEQQILIENCTKYWKIMYNSFWVCGGFAVCSFAILPILRETVQYRELPFEAWYPYNVNSSLVYEFTYFHQVISIWIMAIADINLDTLIVALMVYIAAQCDILCDNLKNLRFTPLKPDYYYIKLLECIKHHKEILSFAQRSNDFISVIVLMQLFVSSLAAALTLFQLSVVEPFSSDMFFLLCYVNTVITQIFIYCWFGNIVETKSTQIPYAIFESEWINVPLKVKKNLVFFAMKAQKPITMSAINLFSLSFATFTTILRTSWSYFAVLRSLK